MTKKIEKQELEKVAGILDSLGKVLGVGAATGIADIAKAGLKNHINELTPQDSPIGELFFDTTTEDISRLYPEFKGVYAPSYPRTSKELVALGGDVDMNPLKRTLLEATMSPPTYLARIPVGKKLNPRDLEFMKTEILDRLKREVAGQTPADLLKKLPSELSQYGMLTQDTLNKASKGLLSGVDDLKFKPNFLEGLYSHMDAPNITDLVKAPRNNLASIAHELGHSVAAREVGDVSKGLAKPLAALWGLLGDPISNIGPVSEVADKTVGKSGLVRELVDSMLLSTSAPVVLGAPLALSSTLREGIKSLAGSDTVDSAMDWVGDNPGTTMGALAAPMIIEEAFTSAPGGEALYKFFNKLKNKAPDVLNHIHGAEVLSKLKNISPNKEVAKFLGHNVGLALAPALIPLAVAAYAYLNNEE